MTNNATKQGLLIRPSNEGDMEQVTQIYAYHVLNGTGTFETEAPSEEQMRARRQDVLDKCLPFLVAEMDGEVLGFAYANWFKPRPAYRFSAEDSIYVAPHHHGQGIGRALLSALVQACEAKGVRKLIAVIGDAQNHGSIGLHAASGFSHAGRVAACGWKFGRWLDIVLMDKELGQGHQTPPE